MQRMLYGGIVGLLLTLTACQSRTQLVVPADKLVDVLLDIHLAEAAANNLYGEMKDTTLAKYYGQVYEIHEITAEEFDRVMQQLNADPVLLNEIYAEVLNRIKLLDASTD